MKRPIRTSSWPLSGRYGDHGRKSPLPYGKRATQIYRLQATQIIWWLTAVGLLGIE